MLKPQPNHKLYIEKWFAPADAGPEDRYLNAASEIWSAYQPHKERVG